MKMKDPKNEMEDLIKTDPLDVDDIIKMNGFGPIKVQKYGADIIRILDQFR